MCGVSLRNARKANWKLTIELKSFGKNLKPEFQHTSVNKSVGLWPSDMRGTLVSGASTLLRPELLAADSSSLSADDSSSLFRRLMTIPLPSLPNIELRITNLRLS